MCLITDLSKTGLGNGIYYMVFAQVGIYVSNVETDLLNSSLMALTFSRKHKRYFNFSVMYKIPLTFLKIISSQTLNFSFSREFLNFNEELKLIKRIKCIDSCNLY